jgi:hypothetical protein
MPFIDKTKNLGQTDYADVGTKCILNTATCEIKRLLNNNRNHNIQTFLQGLTPTAPTDYSLWKAIKKTDHKIISPTTDGSRNMGTV